MPPPLAAANKLGLGSSAGAPRSTRFPARTTAPSAMTTLAESLRATLAESLFWADAGCSRNTNTLKTFILLFVIKRISNRLEEKRSRPIIHIQISIASAGSTYGEMQAQPTTKDRQRPNTHTIINNIRSQSEANKRERLMWCCCFWSCNFLDLLETWFTRSHSTIKPGIMSRAVRVKLNTVNGPSR